MDLHCLALQFLIVPIVPYLFGKWKAVGLDKVVVEAREVFVVFAGVAYVGEYLGEGSFAVFSNESGAFRKALLVGVVSGDLGIIGSRVALMVYYRSDG